jgi:hypothetical protein
VEQASRQRGTCDWCRREADGVREFEQRGSLVLESGDAGDLDLWSSRPAEGYMQGLGSLRVLAEERRGET